MHVYPLYIYTIYYSSASSDNALVIIDSKCCIHLNLIELSTSLEWRNIVSRKKQTRLQGIHCQEATVNRLMTLVSTIDSSS